MDGLRHLLVAMADTDGEDPAEKIQKLFSLGVVNMIILRMVDHERFVVIGGHA
jgi:hypothetical protein